MNEDELKKEAWQYADKVCGWDKTQIFDYLVEAYLASAEPREKRIAELEAENKHIKNSDTLCKVIGEQKIKIAELEDKLANADYQLEGRDIKIKEIEAQIEKMNNQKVFLLQRVDAYDSTIDKQFYTTDEELAIEWSKYVKHSYWYGQAIELEEISDKERIKEELEND